MKSLENMLEAACAESSECSFRTDYSDRGMMGHRCIGIVGSMRDCQRVIAAVAGNMAQELFEVAFAAHDSNAYPVAHALNSTVQDNLDKLFDFRSNSMGDDVIIYWEQLGQRPPPERQR